MTRLKAIALAMAFSVAIPGAAYAVTLADVADAIGDVDPAAALSAATTIDIQPLSGLDNVPEGVDELNTALQANPQDAAMLHSEISQNDVIAGELEAQGFMAEDVVAIADAGGAVTLFVNDLNSGRMETGLSPAPQPAIEDAEDEGVPESIFND